MGIKVNSKSKINQHKYSPMNKEELKKIIDEKIKNKETDFNDIDTSHIIDMTGIFSDKDIVHIDISWWDVSNVESMRAMFSDCRYLQTVGNLDNWNISNVTDMAFMFSGCMNLLNIGDLSKWDVTGKNLKYMFRACKRLRTLSDITEWNCKNPIWEIFELCNARPLPPQKVR